MPNIEKEKTLPSMPLDVSSCAAPSMILLRSIPVHPHASVRPPFCVTHAARALARLPTLGSFDSSNIPTFRNIIYVRTILVALSHVTEQMGNISLCFPSGVYIRSMEAS